MHGHNKEFEVNPFGYISRKAINHMAMKVHGEKTAFDFDDANRYDDRGRIIPGSYGIYNNQVNRAKAAIELAKVGEFDLEPVAFQGGTSIFLRFVVPNVYAPRMEYGGEARGADPSIKAYWLGYLMPGLQGAGKEKMPFVDLPKVAPAQKLMLTGAMNGCSLIVTRHPNDPTLLRVYHDSVHGQDTFQDDVVIARIDYTNEGFASNNLMAPVQGPRAIPSPIRARSGSVVSAPVTATTQTRARSSSGDIGSENYAPLIIPCVRHSYGDMEEFAAIDGKAAAHGNLNVKVRTSFNFLYFDDETKHWVAVSQPLETLPAVAQPVKGWFETKKVFDQRQQTHRAGGTAVAMPPSSPPWEAQVPY